MTSRSQALIGGGGLLILAAVGLVVVLLPRSNGPEGDAPPEAGTTESADADWDEGALAPSRAVSEDEISSPAAAAVCGVVLTERDGPVPGALVALRGPTGSAAVPVEEDGSFCFTGLVPGSYDLAARAGGKRSETVEGLLLDAGEEVRDLALVLRGGTWVSGKVLDRRSGDGVEEAKVFAHCAGGMGLSSAASDRHGEFTLGGVPEGRHRLSVVARGYTKGELLLEVPGRRPVTGVTLILDPVARVSGRVEDESGRPVEGATVRAVSYRLRERPRPVAVEGEGSVRTKADGTFEVEAPPGLVTVHAAAAGHGPGRAAGVEVGPGGDSEGVLIRLPSAAGLLVQVIDSTGRSVPGATVKALCAGEVVCGSGVSDAAGQVTLADLAGGRVRLEATGPSGAGSARLSVEVSSGVRRRLTVALSDDGTLTGTVVNERERPVAGASVVVREDSGAAIARAVADPEGLFHVSVPVEVRLSAFAEAAGANAEKSGVRAGDDIRLVLQPTGAVTGFVTDEAGRAVTDFTVTVSAAGEAGASAVWKRQRFASETGDFALSGLPAGRYRLRACGPGHAAGEEVSIRVWPDDEAGPVELRLSSAGRVRGRVVSPAGSPVAGARVATEPSRLRGLARWSGSPGSAAETDASGTFVLEDVPAGEARRVYAWHPDWMAAAAGPLRVEAGAEAGPVTVTLRPRRGRVRQGPDSFGGVGMTIGADPQGGIRVGEVYEGGPAFFAGLRSGDRIIAVDGRPADGLGLQGTLSAIRGPVGSELTLLVESGGGPRRAVRMVRVELRM